MVGESDTNINSENGPYIFRLNGQTNHGMESLQASICTALYVRFGVDDLSGRMNFPSNDTTLDEATISKLTQMLDRENSLVKIFGHVRDRFKQSDYLPVKLRLVADCETDGRETRSTSLKNG